MYNLEQIRRKMRKIMFKVHVKISEGVKWMFNDVINSISGRENINLRFLSNVNLTFFDKGSFFCRNNF